jgi:hypothetical protein
MAHELYDGGDSRPRWKFTVPPHGEDMVRIEIGVRAYRDKDLRITDPGEAVSAPDFFATVVVDDEIQWSDQVFGTYGPARASAREVASIYLERVIREARAVDGDTSDFEHYREAPERVKWVLGGRLARFEAAAGEPLGLSADSPIDYPA